MITAGLRSEFKLQLEHGGYCTPPGRAMCALERARAACALKGREDVRIRWEYDLDPDLSWCDPEALRASDYARKYFPHTYRQVQQGTLQVLGCIVERKCGECDSWGHAESLWGIVVESTAEPYCRVVEAELLSQTLETRDHKMA